MSTPAAAVTIGCALPSISTQTRSYEGEPAGTAQCRLRIPLATLATRPAGVGGSGSAPPVAALAMNPAGQPSERVPAVASTTSGQPWAVNACCAAAATPAADSPPATWKVNDSSGSGGVWST